MPEERARPKTAAIALFPDSVEGKTSVTVSGGSSGTVLLEHDVVERIVTAATFDVKGERVEVIAEHQVMGPWQ